MKNRLKELRHRHRWSQSDLARGLGVSRQAVNGFESGKFDPSLDMAFKIATLFDVKVEEIFIYEARPMMQSLLERIKNFLGFDFGFERFTEKAINALKFAHNEAVRMASLEPDAEYHLHVAPKHLLAGLLADSTTTAARLLRANGAKMDVATDDRSFEWRESSSIATGPQSKFVLELALQVVRLKGKKTIDTEHLLWGLVRLADADKTTLSEFQQYEIDVDALSHQLAEVV